MEKREALLRADDTTQTILTISGEEIGFIKPYPVSHHIATENNNAGVLPTREAIVLLGIKISSKKTGTKKMIRRLRALLAINKDNAKTGHWF